MSAQKHADRITRVITKLNIKIIEAVSNKAKEKKKCFNSAKSHSVTTNNNQKTNTTRKFYLKRTKYAADQLQ